jgi:hypothetical protein
MRKNTVFIVLLALLLVVIFRPAITIDASDHFYISGNTACIAAAQK